MLDMLRSSDESLRQPWVNVALSYQPKRSNIHDSNWSNAGLFGRASVSREVTLTESIAKLYRVVLHVNGFQTALCIVSRDKNMDGTMFIDSENHTSNVTTH